MKKPDMHPHHRDYGIKQAGDYTKLFAETARSLNDTLIRGAYLDTLGPIQEAGNAFVPDTAQYGVQPFKDPRKRSQDAEQSAFGRLIETANNLAYGG